MKNEALAQNTDALLREEPNKPTTLLELRGRILDALSGDHRLEEVFLNDGFTPAEMEERKLKMAELTAEIIGDSTTQDEMEGRFSEYISLNPQHIRPNDAFKILPSIISLNPFPFDAEQWLTRAMEMNDQLWRTKTVLRFLEIWMDKVSPEKMEWILQRCLETDGELAHEYFALYSDKLLRALKGRPAFLSKIWRQMGQASFLGFLSRLSPSEMPDELKDQFAHYIPDENGALETGRIRSVRHLDYYASSCFGLEIGHASTIIFPPSGDGVYADAFFQDYPRLYGDVTLLHIGNRPVASMKMHGAPSVIGLTNAIDAEGRFLLAKGGVYSTSRKIVKAAESAYKKQGKWARLDVDDLPLMPIRFFASKDGYKVYAKFMNDLDNSPRSQNI